MATKQTGIRFEEESLLKLKYIAWFDRTTVTDIIATETDAKIKDWEKTNGAITPKQIEDAKIK